MATVYGVNRTLKRTGTANTIAPELCGASVKWVYDSYEASTLAVDTGIQVFGVNIPVGARVVDWIIDHDALDTAAITFGTVEDPDEFMTITDATGADKKNFTDDGVAASLGFTIVAGATVGNGQICVITNSGGTTTSGTIKVALCYSAKE